jgi:DNA (cytosine-5)-methyltransferase 1
MGTGEAFVKAIGITCGIGSLLVGAKQSEFEILGNIEWRDAYHVRDAAGRNTFTENFPGATLHENLDHMTMDEIERFMGVELAMGHPECGRYSVLSGSLKDREERSQDPADIPLFVDLVAKLRPRFLVMDDLPKSLGAFPMSEYHRRLPGYDLFPEWVSNWGYGNVQKGRNRMFMLGARRDEQWVFVPSEVRDDAVTVRSVLEDLGQPRRGSNILNHDPHDNTQFCYRALSLHFYHNRPTWLDAAEYFASIRPGESLEYVREDGSRVRRIGFVRDKWDGTAHVITGGNPSLHNIRCDPYTIRERARIQGFPDDFVFYGTVLNERGEWHHYVENAPMIKQTGKAMPVQFARYISGQISAHIRGEKFEASGQRILKPNEHVDQAKRWYCLNVGYSDQIKACGACWMQAHCEIRVDKYKIGAARPKPPPPRPPRPPGPPPEPPQPAARGLQSQHVRVKTEFIPV